MRGKFTDLVGRTFGRLSPAYHVRNAGWFCRCSCGGAKTVKGGDLTDGKVSSCGCMANLALASISHGMTGSPEYICWKGMKARCLNPKHRSFAEYAGRGISICPTWIDNFEQFFEDMGLRPSSLHSIDRIDNDKGYFPDNCRWATKKEQANNRRVRSCYRKAA